jgi:hypothetical protein
VRRDSIGLFSRVRPADIAFARSTTGTAADDDDVAVPDGRLALHAEKIPRDVEDQVVARTFGHGSPHRQPESKRG